MNICFIGAGNMAYALAEGIYNKESHVHFHIFDISEERIKLFTDAFTNCTAYDSIISALEKSQIAYIAVKPQIFPSIFSLFKDYKNILISIMAGISITVLEQAAPAAAIIRVMPNAPALVGKMAAGYSIASSVSEKDRLTAESILKASGYAVQVKESLIDAVTALSGSGPAFFAHIFEAFINGAVSLGLDEITAKQLCLHTVTGTAALMDKKNLSTESLKKMVTSKGGTTAAGRHVLENSEISNIISATMTATAERSKELGK